MIQLTVILDILVRNDGNKQIFGTMLRNVSHYNNNDNWRKCKMINEIERTMCFKLAVQKAKPESDIVETAKMLVNKLEQFKSHYENNDGTKTILGKFAGVELKTAIGEKNRYKLFLDHKGRVLTFWIDCKDSYLKMFEKDQEMIVKYEEKLVNNFILKIVKDVELV